MLSLSQFQIKLSEQFISPAFSIEITTPGSYVLAGRNSAGKSLLLTALAGNGKPVAGQRNADVVIGEVSVEKQQALIEKEKQKDSADILDVVPTPTRVFELFAQTNADYHTHPLYEKLVHALRIEHILDNAFLSLSTGETRKVLIVMAWLSNASLILLDEPFEGLDVEAIAHFSAFLNSQTQASLILSANKLADIPKQMKATLIVMDNLAVAWRSDSTLSYEQICNELRTWFALGAEDVSAPPALTHDNENTSYSNSHQEQNAREKPLPDTLIQLVDGWVKYDNRTIFENLNFTLKKNEHWQITGPNGSGKTCLLQMFTGDNPHCYTNNLTLFGIKRGTGESIWDIKKHIGIMSNALHMQYKVSASLEHVIISGFHDSIGLYSRPTLKERECAEQWLSVLGLQSKKHESFQSLSFGDQRLVLIARAMVKHPTLLILDEPCNGLDEFNRQKTLKLIDILARTGNSTLLYVTHNSEERIPSIQHVLNIRDYNPTT